MSQVQPPSHRRAFFGRHKSPHKGDGDGGELSHREEPAAESQQSARRDEGKQRQISFAISPAQLPGLASHRGNKQTAEKAGPSLDRVTERTEGGFDDRNTAASAVQHTGAEESSMPLDSLAEPSRTTGPLAEDTDGLGGNNDEDLAYIEQMRREGNTASDLRHLGISAKGLKDAGYSARELRFAHYAYEQLVEAGFSQEAIKLAGYGKLSWTFGGYTWGTKIGLPAGENIDAFSDTSSAVDGDAPAIHARNSEAGHRDIAAHWVGPTFTQWQELLEAAKRKRGSRDDDGSSIGVLGA